MRIRSLINGGLGIVALVGSLLANAETTQTTAGKPGFWPRSQETTAGTFTVYQPQVDAWDGFQLTLHAVGSFQPPDPKRAPIFGVLHYTAATLSDRADRIVYLNNVTVTSADFPAVSQGDADYKAWFQWLIPPGQKTMPLSQLEADLAIAGVKKTHTAVVENAPPQIVFSTEATVLVYVDGNPVWRAMPNTKLERVINTRALALRQGEGGAIFVHLLDGWISAPTLAGPWAVAERAPSGATALAKELGKAGTVDLMEGNPDPETQERPSLGSGVPQIVVAFKPTEMITFQGAADWSNIQGSNLIYVKNTTGNVFRDVANNTLYVLISGRWFSASSMAGPWAFVPAENLPPDFAQIPDASPKENVKASIPGTQQAQEAVIAASVPQTALVYPSKLSFKPNIAGVPVLQTIVGTPLFYVMNSPDPIIQVSPELWYAVQNGVWFYASSIQGPWVVAPAVPAVIYTIPPSSPVYYVTYVQIYNVTASYIVVGYTPGYMGAVVTPSGVVVYGTGYVYSPYIGATVWYGPPVTYGYGAAVVYTPWTGWTVGYGFGMPPAAVCWGPAPYWGPYYGVYGYHGAYYGSTYGYHGAAAWGPGGWAATSGNVYSHYGSTSVVSHSSAGYNAYTGNAWDSQAGHSYNSMTGQMSAGQHGSVSNAYTGGYASESHGATYNPNTGASASGSKYQAGNAYTGQQANAAHGTVTSANGQTNSYSAAHASGSSNYYGSSDGNVYKYNSQTGQTQQYDKNSGGWNNTSSNYASQSHNSWQSASQRSSSSQSWGSGGGGGWGGGGGGGDHEGGGGGGGWGGGGGGGWDHGGGGGGWGGGGGGWGGRGGGGGRR